jgi:hypothetical protein
LRELGQIDRWQRRFAWIVGAVLFMLFVAIQTTGRCGT